MGEMWVCGIDTGLGSSLSKGLDTNNFVSRLILSNNLSYNIYSFAWELVYLGKNSSLKMVCVEQKMAFSCT